VVFHRLQLRLLFRRQLVLDANRQPKMQLLDFAFRVQDLVELRQRQTLVHRIRFHGFVQDFHSILHLPLQIVKARRGSIDLTLYERLLFVGQRQLSLMLHHQLWREHRIAERIMGRPWWLRSLSRLWRPWPLGRLRLLGGRNHTQKKRRGENGDK